MPQEIEKKFALEPGRLVPELHAAARGASRTMTLRATYYDTPELALARHRITLRRREGGHDAGWHLKLPGDAGARTEVHAALTSGAGSRAVPAELRARVADIVQRQPLLPVAAIETERTETELLGPRGGVRALLADDTVLVDGGRDTWRELEVEHVAGPVSLLEDVADELAAAGIPLADHPSKLVRALGDRLTTEATELGADSSAGAVLGAYLAAQVGEIQAREPGVRALAADDIHQTRIAIRRLRSTLRTFRPLFDESRTERLRAELAWLGNALGGARDAEVVGERLRAALAELPDSAVVGPVRERLEAELAGATEGGRATLDEALDSPRYRRLADALVALLAEPAFVAAAERPAAEALPALMADAAGKPSKRWADARRNRGAVAEALRHEARKKAKAARYAAEAAKPALGKGAVKRWTEVTTALGEFQDTVVARERLLALAVAAQAAGESAFSYGVLYEREAAAGEAAARRGGRALKKAGG